MRNDCGSTGRFTQSNHPIKLTNDNWSQYDSQKQRVNDDIMRKPKNCWVLIVNLGN